MLRVGENQLVCQLMKGIFNKRPPLPWYTQTWKVHQVISSLEGLCANAKLSLKQLSWKLVVLLALTSAEWGSELAGRDLRFTCFYPEGYWELGILLKLHFMPVYLLMHYWMSHIMRNVQKPRGQMLLMQKFQTKYLCLTFVFTDQFHLLPFLSGWRKLGLQKLSKYGP